MSGVWPEEAVDAAAEVLQQRIAPMTPWAESNLQDEYRQDARLMLEAALSIVFAERYEAFRHRYLGGIANGDTAATQT